MITTFKAGCLQRALLTRQFFRQVSSASSLVYESYGPPTDVLQLKTVDLPSVGPHQALVEFLAAPINPSDINTIEGKYPLKPPLPAVPGNEGVGVVLEVGSDVTNIKIGDAVVPLETGLGTWRQAGVVEATALHAVPRGLPVDAAATMTINPPTALRMLEEFVALRPGDVVIQNGANSAVGRAVIQLCRAAGVETVNVVRDRPGIQALTDELMALGATVVTTEEALKTQLKEAGLAPPALALNCVGGSSGTVVAKSLGHSGTMVTYGGMSMKPVSVPTSLLIFKDLRLRGFWMSQSGSIPVNEARQRRAAVLDRVANLMLQGMLLQPTAEHVRLRDYKEALKQQQLDFRPGKTLFKLQG